MGVSNLHIARDGQELGMLSREDALTLLESGFLRGTDEFSPTGRDDWRPLTELTNLEGPGGLQRQLFAAKDAAFEKARSIFKQAARNSAAVSSSAVRLRNAATATLLNDYSASLAVAVNSQLSAVQRSAASALKDEVFLRKLFGAVYDTLPKQVHRFVEEPQFVDFCLKNRNRLLRNSAPEPE